MIEAGDGKVVATHNPRSQAVWGGLDAAELGVAELASIILRRGFYTKVDDWGGRTRPKQNNDVGKPKSPSGAQKDQSSGVPKRKLNEPAVHRVPTQPNGRQPHPVRTPRRANASGGNIQLESLLGSLMHATGSNRPCAVHDCTARWGLTCCASSPSSLSSRSCMKLYTSSLF